MRPMLEEQPQQEKKRRHAKMKGYGEILQGCEKLENKVRRNLTAMRNSRKRNRSPTVTLSSSSSVCSIASTFTSKFSKDNNREKKCSKSRTKYCLKKSYRRRSSSKNRDFTSKKFLSETEWKRLHENSPMSREIKREKIKENSMEGIKRESCNEVASTRNDRAREIKQEIKKENESSVDEKKSDETVHETLSPRWAVITKEGLLDEIKEELLSSYRLTDDYEYLKAPKLNKDLEIKLKEKYIKSDRRQVSIQNRVSSTMVAIGKALGILLSCNEDLECVADVVDILVDAGSIQADVHHDCSMKRRLDVVSAFDLGNIADLSRVEESLFGEQFLNILKSAKSLNKPRVNRVKPTRGERMDGAKNCEERINGAKNLDDKTNKGAKDLAEKIDNGMKKSIDVTNDGVKNLEEKTSNGEKKSSQTENEDTINSDEKVISGAKNPEERTSTSAKNSSETRNEGTKNSDEKVNGGAKNQEKKTCNGANNLKETTNNSTKESDEKVNDGAKNPKEKMSNGANNLKEMTNNGAKDSNEKVNDCAKNLEEKTSDGAKNSDEKVDTGAKNSQEKKSNEVANPGEKKNDEKDSLDKTNNSAKSPEEKICHCAKDKMAKQCKAQENSEKEAQSEQKNPEESQSQQKILTEISSESKRETVEDVFLNVKTASLRVIDEITAVYQKHIHALQSEDIKCKAEIKVAKETAASIPFPGIHEALKRAYMSDGLPEAAAKTMLHSLAASTMKSYERPVRFWWEFCTKRGIDVYRGTVQNVIQFFVDYESMISSHNVLATWRSALGEFTIEDLGKSKTIANYFKGFKFGKTEKQ